MTQAEFLNGLRILYSLDSDEVGDILNGLRILRSLDSDEVGDPDWWPSFRDDPYRFMMHCSDARAALIWAAMNRRGELFSMETTSGVKQSAC
jgi:hypothetical protein